MVDENRVKGFATNLGGKVQDAVGGLTGDTSMQAIGKMDQATGKVQGTLGKTMDSARDFASDMPLRALVGASIVGLVLGFFLARR